MFQPINPNGKEERFKKLSGGWHGGKSPSTTMKPMFHARPFSQNFTSPAQLAACARVITPKTTTIKG
jgi:hypothetical protein